MMNVRRGDVVVAEFNGLYSAGAVGHRRVVKVERVKERYDRFNGGENVAAPLIVGRNVETSDTEHFDVSYVTEILSREPWTPEPLPNIFSENNREALFFVKRSRGKWTGPLSSLLVLALSTVTSVPLRFGLDRERATALYRRDGFPGCLEHDSETHFGAMDVYSVRVKVFRRWVQRNASKLCLTRRQIDEAELSICLHEEEMYRLDCEADLRAEEEECEQMFSPDYDQTEEPWR